MISIKYIDLLVNKNFYLRNFDSCSLNVVQRYKFFLNAFLRYMHL